MAGRRCAGVTVACDGAAASAHSRFAPWQKDTRSDEAEGEARHVVLGVNQTPVNFEGTFHNPVFILCFSEPDAPSIVEGRYGRFIHRIDDVEDFTSRLLKRLEHLELGSRELMGVTLLRARYSRDTIIDPEPDSEERWRLMVCKKPISDARDREWRIAATFSGPLAGTPSEIWTDALPEPDPCQSPSN